jgi:hypothetical protein
VIERHSDRFALAHELKQSLHDVMGWREPMTHRQFLCWQCWLQLQWNVPNRSDHYVMQLTAMQSTKTGANSDDFKIEFKFPVVKNDSPTSEVKNSRVSDDERTTDESFFQETITDQLEKPLGPRRLTKEDVANINARLRMAQIAITQKSKDGK